MRARIGVFALMAALLGGVTLTGQPVAHAQEAPAGTRTLYYEREITEPDLAGRSLRELSIMRNTIFARAGNKFRKAWLREYFTAQPWYKAKDKSDLSTLTKIDHKNAKIIGTRESSVTTEELQKMLAAVQARQKAGKATPEDKVELSMLSQRLGKWVGAASTPSDTRNPLEDPSLLDKLLSIEQLADMSRRDLRILRNTIYARHGYVFKSVLLTDYFQGTDWYKPDSEFTPKRLTSVDTRNVKLIKSVENTLGGPLTDHEHKTEEGWFVAA